MLIGSLAMWVLSSELIDMSLAFCTVYAFWPSLKRVLMGIGCLNSLLDISIIGFWFYWVGSKLIFSILSKLNDEFSLTIFSVMNLLDLSLYWDPIPSNGCCFFGFFVSSNIELTFRSFSYDLFLYLTYDPEGDVSSRLPNAALFSSLTLCLISPFK